ncbi:MAG: ribonuclease P protein component [Desulfobacteraceae bacterium]
MGPFSFPKEERLLDRSDFVNLNRSGTRYHTKHFIVILKKNESGITRLGITAGKRVGNAVRRNRIKRLIREFFRLNKANFPKGFDIAVIAKKDASCFDLRRIEEELGHIVCKTKFRL